jgi:hypothetical protein
MRCIVDRKAYDTRTGDFIVECGGDERDQWIYRLYRTRNGRYFLYEAGPNPTERPDHYEPFEGITPLSDEEAQEWLERNANGLVEKYFGEAPEAGAAERRFTLRLADNLATRLEAIAQSKGLTLTRYIVRCLERCASQDGKPALLPWSDRLTAPSQETES